jgi:hypothetical protein
MRWYLFIFVAGCVFAWAASSSRSSAADAGNGSGDTSNPGEPITGEPAVPNEPPASVPKNPFEPYGIGETTVDSNPAWSYEQLSDAERVVVDRGRDASGWSAVHETYKAAAALRAAEAQAQAAAIQLGLQNLGEGVVP